MSANSRDGDAFQQGPGQAHRRGREREQAALAELSQAALRGDQLPSLFNSALALVSESLRVRYSDLLELMTDEHTLLLRAGIGWKPGLVGERKLAVDPQSQAGFVLSSNRRLVIDDLREDTPFQPSPWLAEHGIVSSLMVLVPGRNRPFGTLGAHSPVPRSFSQEDIHLLQSVANVIAMAAQRQQDEQTIRQNEAHFRGLVESLPDSIVIVDAEGAIQLVNKETEKLFGYRRDQLLGQRIEMLVPERYRLFHAGHRADYLAEPRVRPMGVGLELFGRRRDGSEFPVEISLSPVQTAQGMMITAAIRDVSERRKTEEQIKKLNSELEEALRRSERLATTGRLMTSLAHEISNPLDALSNLMFLLQSRTVPAERDLVNTAVQELERLRTITQQTLAPHRQSLLPVIAHATELLDGTCQSFSRRLGESHVQVVKSYHRDPLVRVQAGELRQVLTNLISNAIDAMPNGGRLLLEVDIAGDHACIRVGDTGHGIRPEVLPEIFKPFFTTKGEKGLGVGLWVSRRIVEKMGGDIQVTSSTDSRDHGTSFVVKLPLAGVEQRIDERHMAS